MPFYQVAVEYHHPKVVFPGEVQSLVDGVAETETGVIESVEKVERATRNFKAANPDDASAKARANMKKVVRKFMRKSVVYKNPTEDQINDIMLNQVRIVEIRRLNSTPKRIKWLMVLAPFLFVALGFFLSLLF